MEYVGIFAAGTAAYVFGAIWYGIWAKPWMAAVDLKEEDIRGPDAKQSFWPYVVAAICVLVVATMMDHYFTVAYVDELWEGAFSGLCVGLFFVMPWIITNYAYGMRPTNLTYIDGGYAVGGCTLIGLVLMLL